MRFQNRAAIVTGGAQGIGKAVCMLLAEEGANVLVADVLGRKAEKVRDEIASRGGTAAAFELDVSDSARVGSMVDRARTDFGKIDILVNAAGIFRNAPIADCSEEDWDQVMAVNLKGTFLCAQAVGRQMIKQENGSIVNIASISGKTPQLSLGAYSPSKAGVIMLTRLMAMEWAQFGINVNAVCPGPTATEMYMNIYDTEEKLNRRKKSIPLNRVGDPGEVAGAVAYLCSEEAGFITGESLVIDGGSLHSMSFLMEKLPANE